MTSPVSDVACSDGVYLETKTPLAEDVQAALRASATARCWKRAADLPSHLRVVEAFTPNRAGQQLWYESVFPAAGIALRGVVLFIHGIHEHSARYFHVFEDLAEMGFGVVAYDLRSHGKTHMDVPKLRGHVGALQHMIDDTNDFIAFTKKDVYAQMGVADASLPFIVTAFSMGTLVAVLTALSEQHHIDALILGGPLVGVEMTPLLRGLSAIGGLLVPLMPTARTVPGVNEKWVCRDELVGKDYDADPLTVRAQLTSRMGKELGDGMTRLAKITALDDPESAFCRMPILFIMGSLDRVCNLPSAKKFHERIANKDKQFIEVDGCYHVLFEDFERKLVMDNIQQWLHARFPVQA